MSKHGKRHYCTSAWDQTTDAGCVRKAALPKAAVLCGSLTLWRAKFLTAKREWEGKGSTLWWGGRASGPLAKGSCYRCVGGDEVCGKRSIDTLSPASQLKFPPSFSLLWDGLEPSWLQSYAPFQLSFSMLKTLSLLHPSTDPGAS